MEKSPSLPPEKSGSFSYREEKKQPEPARNLSMSALKSHAHLDRNSNDKEERERPEKVAEEEELIKEGEEEEKRGEKEDDDAKAAGEDAPAAPDLATISEEIDLFLDSVSSLGDGQNQADDPPVDPPGVPESAVEALLGLVEKEIAKYDVGEDRPVPAPLSCQDHGEFSLLDAMELVSRLTAALGALPSEPGYRRVMDRAGAVLQRAMAFLEEEFRLLLEDSRGGGADSCKWTVALQGSGHETERSPRTPGPEQNPGAAAAAEEDSPAAYPPETVERLRRIAGAMLSAGYETECSQVFSIARRNAFEAGLSRVGFERISIDEVQRMPWEALEGEVATWIKAFRRSASVSFSRERDLCAAVFSGAARPDVASALFTNLVRGVVIHLLNFAEAVAMTKRSAEKLFKFLDMYETLRDLLPLLDTLFPSEADEEEDHGQDGSVPSPHTELKAEVCSARSRLGDAAVGIFSDLEASIRSDVGKTPVPGGAVHPLTRYVMNYLKYACEYKNTLEEVFKEHQRSETTSSSHDEADEGAPPPASNSGGGAQGGRRHHHQRDGSGGSKHSPFAAQLVTVMELLDANLESKSKLYKDPPLSSIFLMNNGRYIVQKIKGSAEIHSLLGDTWCRRRSSDLRQYHKNYQRETWGKVLGCFRDEGLQVKGSVSKPVLKERFKSFNAMVEEIHKTQSGWVVSDEQLQSELRVSVSAVVVPAYRSFLGRFQQYLDAGRQSEKYIKFGPDDLEAYIDDLFDGNPASAVRRRA